MEGQTSKETHFRLEIVSEAFKGLGQLQRHRKVNGILKEELDMENGVHALQLKTKTPEEVAGSST